jgi:hypothetical protein
VGAATAWPELPAGHTVPPALVALAVQAEQGDSALPAADIAALVQELVRAGTARWPLPTPLTLGAEEEAAAVTEVEAGVIVMKRTLVGQLVVVESVPVAVGVAAASPRERT